MDTKAMSMWKISKEQEEIFRKGLPVLLGWDEFDIAELFKLVRGAEYRRGKEDERNSNM